MVRSHIVLGFDIKLMEWLVGVLMAFDPRKCEILNVGRTVCLEDFLREIPVGFQACIRVGNSVLGSLLKSSNQTFVVWKGDNPGVLRVSCASEF